MAGHRYWFADFANQARNQNIARLIFTLQGTGEPCRNAHVGPVAKRSLGRLARKFRAHSCQHYPDLRAAEFRFKYRPFSGQSHKISAPLPRGEFCLNRERHQYFHGH